MKKKLFPKLQILLLFVTTLNAMCGDGCLKCGENERCLFCDYTSEYIIKDGSCEKSPNPGCKIMDQNGRCMICDQSHFLDMSVGLCAEVPNDKQIKNCVTYGTLTTCKKCAPNSFLQNGLCFNIEIRVPGCKVQGKDICLECDDGKILHPNKQRCIEDPKQDNCLNYGYLKCNKCKEGFIINPNFFLYNLFGSKANLDQPKVAGFLNSVLNTKIDDYRGSPCQPIDINNCQVLEDSYRCKICMPSFFLNEQKKCQPFPLPQIPNCKYYLNNNECLICNDNFLLASRSECKPVKVIQNCTKYANNVSANICVECVKNFYVVGNLCRERTQIVDKCDIYSPQNDNCQKCVKDFGLSTNKLVCLSFTENCDHHNFTITTGQRFPCVTCRENYYLDSNACFPGSIMNCAIYANQNACLKCQIGFYSLNNVCTPNLLIERCKDYENSVINTCVNCENNSVLIQQKVSCSKIKSEVPFCSTYSNTTTCSSCLDKYTLIANQCIEIPAIENCLNKTNNNCIRCENGYILSNGICKAPFLFQTQDCLEKSLGTANSFTCEKCEADRMPWKHNINEFHCIMDVERLGTNSQIANCLLYDKSNNQDICIKCKEGFILNEDMDCVNLATCQHISLDFDTMTLSNTFPSYMTKNVLHICKTTPEFQNCKIASRIFTKDGSNLNNRGCVLCKDNFIPIMNLQMGELISNIKFDPSNIYASNRFNFLYSNPVSCAEKGVNNYFIPGPELKPTPNCDSYSISNNQFFCQKCAFGYTGKNTTTNYVTCEKKIDECDITTYYGNNLDSKSLRFVNCHQCLSKDKIPFIFLANDFTAKPFEFTFTNVNLSDTANDNGEWLQCLEPNGKSFKMGQSKFTARFPENCGIGFVIINIIKDFRTYTDSTSIYCKECKPGFRPIMNNNKIFKCEKINNCNINVETKWFNSCSKCNEGFAWLYTTKLNYDICVKTKDRNCLITRKKVNPLDFSFVKSKTCVKCKKGYSIGYDGICTIINSPFCKDGEYRAQPNYNYDSTLIISTWNMDSKMTGCNECQEGFVGYRLPDFKTSCVKDSSMQTRANSFTRYVKNCRNFKLVDETPLCVVCEVGYVVSSIGTKCVRQDTNPNCMIVNSNGNLCQTCHSKFVLIKGFCEIPRIINCITYQPDQQYQKCTSCADSFTLINNNCVRGGVANCKRYNNDQICTECYLKYQLINTKNSRQYCLPIPEEFHCLTFQNNNLNIGELSCDTCDVGFALSTLKDDLVNSACIPLLPVQNCKEYDNTSYYYNSSFECVRCFDNFYLKDNNCLNRTVVIENCNIYSPTNNYCDSCLDGYFLANDKTCEQFPSGIYGCKNYQDSVTCISCREFMYLRGNTCVDIDVKQRIPHCQFYEGINQCIDCEMNYYLNNAGNCELARAQNCETFKSSSECRSCPPNFGLYEEMKTGIVSCLYISTPNCESTEIQFPFNCIKCNKFFYTDEGKCLPNEKFIPFCEEYESRDTCKKCETNFILNQTHKECLTPEQFGIEPFESCEENEQTMYPLCIGCNFGSQFYKGQCIVCKIHTVEAGCLYCEGIDEETCLICKPGYYQDISGICVVNGQQPGSIVLPTFQGNVLSLVTLLYSLIVIFVA